MTGNYTGSEPDDYDDSSREPDDYEEVVDELGDDQTQVVQFPDEATPDEQEHDESPTTPTSPPVGPGGSGGSGGGSSPAAPVDGTPDSAGEPHSDDEERESNDSESQNQDVEPEDLESDEDADSEEQDDEDEQDPDVTLLQFTDPFCVISWQAEPVMKRLETRYRSDVDIQRRMVPVRHFDDSHEIANKCEAVAAKYGMPVNTGIWAGDSPASTEEALKAYSAAIQQGDDLAVDYLRQLRIAVMVEGRDISKQRTLLDIADEVGLNTAELTEAMETVEAREIDGQVQTPVFVLDIDDVQQTWRYPSDDLEAAILGAGLKPDLPPSLKQFIDEHGPVATQEVMTVYEWDRQQAEMKLTGLAEEQRIINERKAGTDFWRSL